MILEFSREFLEKNTLVLHFTEIFQLGDELLSKDGRTDMTSPKVSFSQSCEHAQKERTNAHKIFRQFISTFSNSFLIQRPTIVTVGCLSTDTPRGE